VSDPQQPIPQPDPIPQPAPEPAPEPAPPAPQSDSNLKTRGPLLLESNSAARLGPAEQWWHAAPPVAHVAIEFFRSLCRLGAFVITVSVSKVFLFRTLYSG
jgi:hypothetical protein